MQNSLSKIMVVCGLVGMLWPDHAVSQTTAPPRPAPQRATTPSPDNPTRYVPLGQILPRATQESGIQIQAPDPLLKEQVPVREAGPDRNLNLDPVLDEFSRIELFGNDSELQKVIILNRNTGAQNQAPVFTPSSHQSPKTSSPPSPAKQPLTRLDPSSLPTTNLSRKQLQALIRGAYRSPLPEKLWDDPQYREFLISQGIGSREEMKDRNKAKNIRKTVRRMLWKLKNKS